MTSMLSNNRRKYPRANYPCYLTLWVASGMQETILANTSNIGVGGLSVHLNQSVRVGTKVDIQLLFSNTTTPFKCSGVVIHSGSESKKFHNVGIQFEPLGEIKTAFLEGKVSEILALEHKGNKA